MPAPPNRRPDPVAHLAHLYTSLIPDAVLKAISADELNDRLVEATRLSAQASDPAVSADLRKAAKLRSQAVLTAQPRDVTRRQHREMIAKAAAAPPAQAAAIRRKAVELIEERHPVAPSRRSARIAKGQTAPEDQPIPVFNSAGLLVGVVLDPDQMTPISTAYEGPSAQSYSMPEDMDGQVMKSGQVVVYDQWRRPYRAERRNVVTRVRLGR
jgi:hypothetical protein